MRGVKRLVTTAIVSVSATGFVVSQKQDNFAARSDFVCGPDGITSPPTGGLAAGGEGEVVRSSGTLFPASFGPGASWTFSQTVQTTLRGKSERSETHMTARVVGEERVAVPAGSFAALKVVVTFTLGAADARTRTRIQRTSWYARGVGMVKQHYEGDLTLELVSYRL